MFSVAVLLLCVSSSMAQIAEDDIPLITEIDVPSYLGRFYQIYASPAVLETFEKNGTCITATYGLANSSALTVYNHMLLHSPDGPVSDINGIALTSDDPAKLSVYFDTAPVVGVYWIMELGPLREYDGELLYTYSLVTDNRGIALFVLARDPEEFELEFEADILDRLNDIGFNLPLNSPVKGYHGDDCAYPDN